MAEPSKYEKPGGYNSRDRDATEWRKQNAAIIENADHPQMLQMKFERWQLKKGTPAPKSAQPPKPASPAPSPPPQAAALAKAATANPNRPRSSDADDFLDTLMAGTLSGVTWGLDDEIADLAGRKDYVTWAKQRRNKNPAAYHGAQAAWNIASPLMNLSGGVALAGREKAAKHALEALAQAPRAGRLDALETAREAVKSNSRLALAMGGAHGGLTGLGGLTPTGLDLEERSLLDRGLSTAVGGGVGAAFAGFAPRVVSNAPRLVGKPRLGAQEYAMTPSVAANIGKPGVDDAVLAKMTVEDFEALGEGIGRANRKETRHFADKATDFGSKGGFGDVPTRTPINTPDDPTEALAYMAANSGEGLAAFREEAKDAMLARMRAAFADKRPKPLNKFGSPPNPYRMEGLTEATFDPDMHPAWLGQVSPNMGIKNPNKGKSVEPLSEAGRIELAGRIYDRKLMPMVQDPRRAFGLLPPKGRDFDPVKTDYDNVFSDNFDQKLKALGSTKGTNRRIMSLNTKANEGGAEDIIAALRAAMDGAPKKPDLEAAWRKQNAAQFPNPLTASQGGPSSPPLAVRTAADRLDDALPPRVVAELPRVLSSPRPTYYTAPADMNEPFLQRAKDPRAVWRGIYATPASVLSDRTAAIPSLGMEYLLEEYKRRAKKKSKTSKRQQNVAQRKA